MKKTIKTKELMEAYQVLGSAKYQKLSDEDKVKVWKITRQLKPHAMKYMEDEQDAREKMMPYEGFQEQVAKAQQYELERKAGREDLQMTEQEYFGVVADMMKYNKVVDDAFRELQDKEVEIDVEPLSEDAFAKLMSSNDWNMQQAVCVSDIFGL